MKLGIAMKRWGLVAFGGLVLFTAPAQAQFYSDGYKFLEAIRDKDADAVIAAVNEPGSTIVNSRDITTGESALHIVTARRDMTWLTYLTERGANPNIKDGKGVTPLVVAAQIGFVDGVEALVKAGARVDEASKTGETPLIAAVHRRDTEMMRVLLKAGANPDRADNSGRTARDYALYDGERSATLAEIEKSAKPANEREGASPSYGPSF